MFPERRCKPPKTENRHNLIKAIAGKGRFYGRCCLCPVLNWFLDDWISTSFQGRFQKKMQVYSCVFTRTFWKKPVNSIWYRIILDAWFNHRNALILAQLYKRLVVIMPVRCLLLTLVLERACNHKILFHGGLLG